MPLLLASPVFSPGGAIPSEYTCDGADISPPVNWSGLPEANQSLVLIVEDPDAPVRHLSAIGPPSTSRPARPGSRQAMARTARRSDFAKRAMISVHLIMAVPARLKGMAFTIITSACLQSVGRRSI